ncbi:MAG: hypothetical protein KIT48_11055 [Pseudolabrys sp.]|jgi:hypothetical protein|nr:hypothetical protein [Pseudolabrys sp.]
MITNRIGVQFGWNAKNSAYQNIKAQRARLANFASSRQSTVAALGSALTGAVTSQISGMANIAAQKAVTRLSAQIKAATAARDQQLADAQSTLMATQSAYNSSSLANVSNGGSVNIAT